MSPTTRRIAWALLPLVLLTACGSEAEPRDSATSPAPAAAESAGPAGPALDGTEPALRAGQTKSLEKTWEITYQGLESHVPADRDIPPGWDHEGPTWLATFTLRNLLKEPVRIRPTMAVQSGEGVAGVFGGFLAYEGASDLKPDDRLELRALVGTQGTDGVKLVLDLGAESPAKVVLMG
ncbi:hypothetical protein [Actinocorallia libanotica]|uniref:hypothetical protein n=1 Tax=Actinocorallia libanotica TaxID=46162 RepID=UPI0031E17FBC